MLPNLAQLEARVAEVMAKWRVPGAERVAVSWNERLRTTAGRAFYKEGRIELNPQLLANSPKDLDDVLVHEAAHVAAYRLFGDYGSAHGRHWRGLMRIAGVEPNVTHDLPVPRAARRRRGHVYLRVCDACGDRRMSRAVRYDRCACGSAKDFLVLRAPATANGVQTLQAMTLDEVRARWAQ